MDRHFAGGRIGKAIIIHIICGGVDDATVIGVVSNAVGIGSTVIWLAFEGD